MTLFFQEVDANAKAQNLITRLIRLHQAVIEKKITLAELKTIASLTTASLEAKVALLMGGQLDKNDPLRRLYDLLYPETEMAIVDPAQILDALKAFDEKHGDTLVLAPLASENARTFALALNDFAKFYPLFIQYMQCQKRRGALVDEWNVGINLPTAKLAWIDWARTHSTQARYDPNAVEHPGLIEKFLAGQLKKEEWLTDIDLNRAFKLYDLQAQGAHVIPFKVDDIGLALHFERQKHEKDQPKKAYSIPLIVNVSADGHACIDARGIHWTRLLIMVDPTQVPASITAQYTDESSLSDTEKRKIEACIRAGLKYRDESSEKIYSAFPECSNPKIDVIATGSQQDGYSCGYRALRGLIRDMIYYGQLNEKPEYKKLLDCHNSQTLRDVVYQTLLSQQPLQAQSNDNLFVQSDDKNFYIRPELVKGQLLSYQNASTASREKLPTKQLNVQRLEALVQREQAKVRLLLAPSLLNLQKTTELLYTVNIEAFLQESAIANESNDELALEVLFSLLNRHKHIKELHIEGVSKLEKVLQAKLLAQLDKTPTSIKISANDQSINDYLTLINRRNDALNQFDYIPKQESENIWDKLFTAMLFIPSTAPTQDGFFYRYDLGVEGFTKFLKYLGENEDKCSSVAFAYSTFYLNNPSSLAFLQACKTHLQSETPYLPFKHLRLPITGCSEDDFLNELLQLVPLLEKNGIECLSIALDNELSAEGKNKLLQWATQNNLTTLISIYHSDGRFIELENIILKNKRNNMRLQTKIPAQLNEPQADVVLGKLGKAIFKKELVSQLDTEIQVQQEQQQQVQQQVQTTLANDDLPEEDEISPESFPSYTSDDVLLDRQTFAKTMKAFCQHRHSHLSAEDCWDMITGENAHLFPYGIRKMTIHAARFLVDHLQDVQYGLHPDNLPSGFSLKQESSGDVVLDYTPFEPTENAKQSPLTIQFQKPKPRLTWKGSILQFMTEAEAQNLYRQLALPKPSFDDCLQEFFMVRSQDSHFSIANRLLVLDKLMGLDKNDKSVSDILKELFGVELSAHIIAGVGDILYCQGSAAVLEFLQQLENCKKVKGPLFANLKTCFLDSSKDFNELANQTTYEAFAKLASLSETQLTWWVGLSQQHNQNSYYHQQMDDYVWMDASTMRSANLAELVAAFDYFCGQLGDAFPGLNLTEYMPFTGVADMRVGLDRLLSTILPNTHDINEQFYQSLTPLSLAPLGPFYASRYEGYKWVDPDMQLQLGALSKKAQYDREHFAEPGFCFRSNKEGLGNQYADRAIDSKEAKRTLFLRYVATFNHRATKELYDYAINSIIDLPLENCFQFICESLLVLVAVFGSGKRGKHFTKQDLDNLIAFVQKFLPGHVEDNGANSGDLNNQSKLADVALIFTVWREMRSFDIHPTIAEIIAISDYANKYSARVKPAIDGIQRNASKNSFNAQEYLNALVLLTKNPRGMNFDLVNSMVESVCLYKNLPAPIKGALLKLVAVCDPNGLTEENILEKTQQLLTKIEGFFNKHQSQATCDLLVLLGNIDLQSPNLPTVDQLIVLIQKMTAENVVTYLDLERSILSLLPDQCRFVRNKIVNAPIESGANMSATMTKYMAEIKQALSPYQQLIDEKMGSGFFDELGSANGPKILMGALNDIENLPAFIRMQVSGKVKDVLLQIYLSVQKDGIARVQIQDPVIHSVFIKLMQDKIIHRITRINDFSEFCKQYPIEIDALSKLCANLRRIQQKWPNEFSSIVSCLDNAQSLDQYSLLMLSKITHLFANEFVAEQDFPMETFAHFFAFVSPSQETEAEINAIMDRLYPSGESLETNLSPYEKQLLCNISLKKSRLVPNSAMGLIDVLLQFQKVQPKYFCSLLELLVRVENADTALPDIAHLMVQFSALNEPALVAGFLAHFTKNADLNFLILMHPFRHESGKRMAQQLKILTALLPNVSADSAELAEVSGKLVQLNDADLSQFAYLYSSLRYPSLTELHQELSKEVINFNELFDKFDREPVNKKSARNFDVSNLTHYIAKMRDLNYDRPLFLTQRLELQRWYIYLNAIGDSKPIHTRPWELEQSQIKPVSQMTQNELIALLEHYRTCLQSANETKDRLIKIRLEVIAILRESMYRSQGEFPRPTQILFLLNAMQAGKDFIAQIPTGQGKSLTAALAAAFNQIHGKTVDVCTTHLPLANDGMKKYSGFYSLLKLPVTLVHAGSAENDYQANAIHYSCMSEMALYRSKMQLQGKLFPKDTVLIADEIDFSTLDDNTRYRYAISLDPVIIPYVSPYIWIYDALIHFVDGLQEPCSDEALLEQAKHAIKLAAKSTDQKSQLKNLLELPDVYKNRLESWLMAAGVTAQLVKQEQTKFRIVKLRHAKLNKDISKACILTGNRPNIQAEFSNSVQQFLHLRLRHQYAENIKKGMPDFLIEPEKTYITSKNSKILFNSYSSRMGMSGTVGSKDEIKEQYAKYGFRFVDIPPFEEDKRKDFAPILTNAKWLNNLEAEEHDHIRKIVKEVLRHSISWGQRFASPVLIECADKRMGEKIHAALQAAIDADPKKYAAKFPKNSNKIQGYYSSENQDPDERNKEETEYRERAGLDGMITISTVFGRGTDITPKHINGLYTIQTFADTHPYTAEDLERAKRQIIGRSGRAGAVGFTRLILRRSEFKSLPAPNQAQYIRPRVADVDRAIQALNSLRNKTRLLDRELRESIDDIKEALFLKFFQFIQVVNDVDPAISKHEIRDVLLKQWNLLLNSVDKQWNEIISDPTLEGKTDVQLKRVTEFACHEWNAISKSKAVLENKLEAWAQRHQIKLTLPTQRHLVHEELYKNIIRKNSELYRYTLKSKQVQTTPDETLSEEVIYCDMLEANSKDENVKLLAIRDAAKHHRLQELIQQQIDYLQTCSHKKILQGKFDFLNQKYTQEMQVRKIMSALLYLRYKTFRDENPIAAIEMKKRCQKFIDQIIWHQDPKLIGAIVESQQGHFNKLSSHRGQEPQKKREYLAIIMAEWQKKLPNQTKAWKTTQFTSWWSGTVAANPSSPSNAMQSRMIKTLKDYRDNWWERTWVSSDRKQDVDALIVKIQAAKSSPDILVAISEARTAMLANDQKLGRKVSDGVFGRFNQLLGNLEDRVLAASTPNGLDAGIELEFKNIHTILTRFPNEMNLKIPAMPKGHLFNTKNPKFVDDVKTHYCALLQFFSSIQLIGMNDQRMANHDWRTLRLYCKNAQAHLARYFPQCDQLRPLSKDFNLRVYQAASAAGATWLMTELPIGDLSDTFNYQGYSIPVKLEKFTTDGFFRRVYNTATFSKLLQSIEQSLVEKLPSGTKIHFAEIKLDKSNQFTERNKLTVKLSINDAVTEFNYHIDQRTLSIESEVPKISIENASILAALHGMVAHWERLKELGAERDALTIQKVAEFDLELSFVLKERYSFEVKKAYSENRQPPDFADFFEFLQYGPITPSEDVAESPRMKQ